MAGMKLPTRPAPEPPKVKWLNKKGSLPKGMSYDGDPFMEPFKLSRSQSAGKLGENKKPPPRPPPPPMKLMIGTKSSNRKQSTQLLSGLFSRNNKATGSMPKSQTVGSLSRQGAASGMLIDLSSPPSSPTLTAHSSSDGFSVNSFSSDGILNTGSQIESGFEDDFDLIMASSSTTPSVLDIWTEDTFYSSKQGSQTFAPFELSNEDPRCRHKVSNNVTLSASTKPTIIRPKSSKPARPPPPKLRPSSTPPAFVGLPMDPPSDDWSPPMPSCPPPPPPPEVLTALEQGPSLPPRPSTLIQDSTEKKKPYCIALYDYDAGHPDDLSFRVNDVIHLTERVNSDWMRGRLMGKEGMFPISYTNVVVPLEACSSENLNKYKYVVALYTFRPETWDDLPFQEGDTVKVTKRINDHWLYGESNGRQGQFPENYVTDVSCFFPLQNTYS